MKGDGDDRGDLQTRLRRTECALAAVQRDRETRYAEMTAAHTDLQVRARRAEEECVELKRQLDEMRSETPNVS